MIFATARQTYFLGSKYTKNGFAAGGRRQTHFWCI